MVQTCNTLCTVKTHLLKACSQTGGTIGWWRNLQEAEPFQMKLGHWEYIEGDFDGLPPFISWLYYLELLQWGESNSSSGFCHSILRHYGSKAMGPTSNEVIPLKLWAKINLRTFKLIELRHVTCDKKLTQPVGSFLSKNCIN